MAVLFVACVIGAAASPVAQGADLLTNGSFETPELTTTAWTAVLDVNITDWGDVTLGEDPHLWTGKDVTDLFLEPPDGDQYCSGEAAVTMTTVVGQVYVVRWQAYAYQTKRLNLDLVTDSRVTISGGTLDESQHPPANTRYDFDGIHTRWVSGVSADGGVWQEYLTTFTATAASVTLTFHGKSNDDDFTIAMDSVSVKPFDDYKPEEVFRDPPRWYPPPDFSTYDGPLDVVIGDINFDEDAQVEGNEAQEDEVILLGGFNFTGGIQVVLDTMTPITALLPEDLTAGTAKLRFVIDDGPGEHVTIYDSDGDKVDSEVTWTLGGGAPDHNCREFFVHSHNAFRLKAILEVSGLPQGQSADREQDAARAYGDCPCSESTGAGVGDVRSVDMKIELGQLRYGDSAGYLHLKAESPSADLYTPGALQIFTHGDLTPTNLDQNGGTILAPLYASDLWGAAKVTVVSSTEYRIAFYTDENTMNADTTNSGDTAYRLLTVKKPAGASGNDEIYISETQSHSGTTTRYWHYEYSTSGGTNTWVLTEGKTVGGNDTALRVTRREEVTDSGVRTETLGIYKPDHTNFAAADLVYEVEEVFEEFGWGEEMTSRTVDPDGLAYKEKWTFGTSGTEDGRVIRYESATGYWERYRYALDPRGREYRDLVVSQLHNNALDTGLITTVADNNTAAYLDRNEYTISSELVYVEATYVEVLGVQESAAYVIHRANASAGNDLNEDWRVACTVSDPVDLATPKTEEQVITDILAGNNSANYVISRSWQWKDDYALIDDDSDPGEVYKTLSADGTLTVFDRSYSFRRRTTVMTSGYDEDDDGDINYGTRSTVTLDPRGNVVSSLGERTVTENSWFIESYVARLQEDDFGRPTVTGFYFGAEAKTASTGGTVDPAFQTLDTHACCGTGSFTSHTDRGGVTSRIDMDALGRRVKVTTGDGSISMELETEYGLDAAGNVLTVTSKPLAGSAEPDRVVTSTYNTAGRVTSVQDPESRDTYFTYGRVKENGTEFDPDTDTGNFYWETRRYGHDNGGPVGVSWTDSQGDLVLGFTATTSWTGAAVPTATETLTTEHTRSMTEYKWVDLGGGDVERRVTSRVYHDLSGLAKGLTDVAGTRGTEGTNYLVTSELIADPLGRVLRVTDAAGNISAPEYEDGTGLMIGSRVGVEVNALKDVSGLYFNQFDTGTAQAPTGDRRPYITRVYSVRPGLNEAPAEDANMTDYDYIESDVEFNVAAGALIDRTVWTKPEHLPWSSETFNAQGQRIESRTYENGDDTTFLTATDYSYITGYTTDNNGRIQYIDRFEVNSGTVQTTRLRTELFYNDAGFQLKTATPGRGMTKIELDDYGRVAREVFASSEGTNTDIEGTDAFTDDIVLTEAVYTYNKANQVIQATTYDRAHDATPGTVTGLLSAASASSSRVNYSAFWHDDHARLTHSTDYGTNGGAAFTRPGTAPEPDTSDDRITTKIEYDAAGYAYLTTDNLDVQTRRYYNNAGQLTYVVENYNAAEFTDADDPTTITSREPDECRITAYGYDFTSTNAAGLRTSMTAIDPDADGNTAEAGSGGNQTTHFIYTGEVDSDMRGWVPTNTRLAAVLHADAVGDGVTRANVITEINTGTYGTSGGVHGDFVYNEVYAGGDAHFGTDQRGVVWTNTYTDEGYLDYRVATAATGSGWTAPTDSDVRCEYTYGDAGELLSKTTFSSTSGGTANRLSEVAYTYDGFYNTLTESQDHDPTANAGAGIPRDIAFAYDNTSAANIYTNAYRRNQVTYPNGRVVKLYFAPGSVENDISRVSGIDEVIDSTDTAVTRYTYLGSGRLARKDYPTPDLRLDFINEGTEGSASGGYDESWDRLNRTARLQWEKYDSNGDGAGVAGSDGENVFLTRHGYNRVSRNLYDQDEVYGAYSQVRRFDGLHRMVGQDQGIIELDGSGDVELDVDGHAAVDAFWEVRGRDWELDQVNNPEATDTESSADRESVAYNSGNEITTLTTDGVARIDETENYFNNASDRDIYTEGVNCDPSDNNDVEVTSGYLTIKTGSTSAPAIILAGEGRGPIPFATRVQSPSNSGVVGMVFGYKSELDYWVLGNNFATGNGDWELYHIHDADDDGSIDYTDPAEKELIDSKAKSNDSIDTWYVLFSRATSNSVETNNSGFGDLSEEGGFPSGRYGLYTEVSGAKFDYHRFMSDGRDARLGAAWETTGHSFLYDYGAPVGGTITTNSTWHRQYQPVLLRGPRTTRFQATFTMRRRGDNPNSYGRFIFNFRGPNDYDLIPLYHYPSAVPPKARSFRNGEPFVEMTVDRDSDEVPDRASGGDPIWYRVVSDGVDVKVFAATTESALDTKQDNDEWCMRTTASTDRFAFSDGPGRFGFTGGSYNQYWDDFTLETDPDDDADLTDDTTFETVEIFDTFDLTGGSGGDQVEDTFVYDDAGNLTFNGYQRLTYDAHNRLVKVENAWWDDSAAAGQEVTAGSVVAEYRYDANGRLIVDKRYDGDGLAEVYHRYYVGHCEVESRDGSDQVLSQQIWDSLAPGRYIDSLAQVAHNLRPGVDDDSSTGGTQDLVDTRLYAMQDASYCVMGLATSWGDLVERYEYDAYGQRFVYQRAGADFGEFAWIDVSGDGLVSGDELDLVLGNWGAAVSAYDRSRGNFNGDTTVNGDDQAIVFAAFGGFGGSSNDKMVMTPSDGRSQRLSHAIEAGQALNDFGFQGLRHDDHTGLVNNRARWYDTHNRRFVNTDPHPAIFPDGMSRYAAYHVLYGGVDPWGEKYMQHPSMGGLSGGGPTGRSGGGRGSRAGRYGRMHGAVGFDGTTVQTGQLGRTPSSRANRPGSNGQHPSRRSGAQSSRGGANTGGARPAPASPPATHPTPQGRVPEIRGSFVPTSPTGQLAPRAVYGYVVATTCDGQALYEVVVISHPDSTSDGSGSQYGESQPTDMHGNPLPQTDAGGAGQQPPDTPATAAGAEGSDPYDALENLGDYVSFDTTPDEFLDKIGGVPDGWVVTTLGQGTHAGQGFRLVEMSPNGKPTGRSFRCHPGGGRHGAESYWTATSGEFGKIQVTGPNFTP